MNFRYSVHAYITKTTRRVLMPVEPDKTNKYWAIRICTRRCSSPQTLCPI